MKDIIDEIAPENTDLAKVLNFIICLKEVTEDFKKKKEDKKEEKKDNK